MNVRIPEENITSQSFIVQWDAVTDFFTVNYTVRWYGEDGINGTTNVNRSVTGNRLSHTIAGLNTWTSYNVTVYANNTCCGAGPVSSVIMIMTNMRCPAYSPTPSPTHSPSPSTVIPTATGNVLMFWFSNVRKYFIYVGVLYCVYK